MAHAIARSSPRRSRHAFRLTRDRFIALLMVLPSIIAVAVFVYGFIAWTGYVSISDWNGLAPSFNFVGLQNYADVFDLGRFQTNIRNLIVFTILFLALCLGLGLLLALLVDSRVKAEPFFRSVYIFPMALSFIVTGVAWRWIFSPGNYPADPTGLNLLLKQAGLGALMGDWITDNHVWPQFMGPDAPPYARAFADWLQGIRDAGGLEWLKTRLLVPLAIIPVMFAAVWQMSGFCMAMYLAGLRGISDEIKEAARVDGASELQVFRHVVFPLLRPITLSAVIILGHISLKIFDLVVTMTGGAPGNNTEVPGLMMYEITFKANKFAQGAAVAMVMLVLVALLIVPYLRNQRRQEVEV